MSPWLWNFGLCILKKKTETLPDAVTVRERQNYREGKKVKLLKKYTHTHTQSNGEIGLVIFLKQNQGVNIYV